MFSKIIVLLIFLNVLLLNKIILDVFVYKDDLYLISFFNLIKMIWMCVSLEKIIFEVKFDVLDLLNYKEV